jgi:endonuclease-3
VRESAAERKRRAGRIVRRLARAYPDAKIALVHHNPFELLIATILSAQCTDEKVNEVTAELFRHYPDAESLALANPGELEAIIRPTGFYRQKARSLLATSRDSAERFAGQVPGDMESLTSLRGVARKTANVVLGNAFGIPGLAVDTHMKRVNRRLELTSEEDPARIERDLMQLIPQTEWTQYSQRVIHHGRVCCHARHPRCAVCPLRADCPWPERALPEGDPPKIGARNVRSRAVESVRV